MKIHRSLAILGLMCAAASLNAAAGQDQEHGYGLGESPRGWDAKQLIRDKLKAKGRLPYVSRTVRVQQGYVKGNERNANGILAFKGIPYAKAPVGELRWQAPQRPDRWTGTRDAQQFGASCLSSAPIPSPTPQSEDCLTLNVWTGAEHRHEQRPVMVWIHGGGFQFGSSAEPGYDGTALAKKGVVIVSLNYRLSVFGFLSMPNANGGSATGNFGLQDQIAGLRWVKSNIAAFGGDPSNITLFGESAGAHSVGLLMASPKARGLFDKAILQSGAFWDSEHGSLPTLAEQQERSKKLSRTLGADSLAELRSVSAENLIKAAPWDFTLDPGLTNFAPYIDGRVVPAAPAHIFNNAQQARVPIMAGWNAAEHAPFMARALPHSSAAAFQRALKQKFADQGSKALTLYPARTDTQANASAAALTGDLIISEQTWEAIDSQRRVWQVPSYAYYFSYSSPYAPGAVHGADPSFVFGTVNNPIPILGAGLPEASEEDYVFSEQLMAYWTNFAKRSDPNGPGLPHWPVYNGAGLDVMQLGNTIAPIANPSEARFKFIRSLRHQGVLPMQWRD